MSHVSDMLFSWDLRAMTRQRHDHQPKVYPDDDNHVLVGCHGRNLRACYLHCQWAQAFDRCLQLRCLLRCFCHCTSVMPPHQLRWRQCLVYFQERYSGVDMQRQLLPQRASHACTWRCWSFSRAASVFCSLMPMLVVLRVVEMVLPLTVTHLMCPFRDTFSQHSNEKISASTHTEI